MILKLLKKSFLIILLFFVVTKAQENKDFLFPDTNLPLEKRVDDLISRMTLEEKASQMLYDSKAIPRLNIPKYNWWNECLHGVARSGEATVFPQAIGLAATWDTALIFSVADVISTEARAKHHQYVRKGQRDIYQGLTFWTPNINIFRDPRWGRGQETYGEDPYLTSRIAVSFIKGLQGNDPNYFKAIATAKHYAVHSGPEPERHEFNAVIDDHDLYDTYLPAFEASVKEGGAYSVMCAYNRYLGDACCGSDKLLQKILREDWGFNGYIVSDCWAIDDIFRHHKIVSTGFEASALSIKAGTDLECGSLYDTAVVNAVHNKILTEDELDISLKRLFTARFKLGMFDPPEMVKYSSIPFSENDSEENRKLALKAAYESIVLLKNTSSPGDNTKNILPLSKDLKRIAVIGPTADSYPMLLGNYNGTPSRYVTPLQGIKNIIKTKGLTTEIVYEQGCDLADPEGIVNHLSPLAAFLPDGKTPGLKAEIFRNRDFSGQPAYTITDLLDRDNLIFSSKMPGVREEPEFSIRWTGIFKVPDTGLYDFTLKGDDGFRLYIDDKLVIEDWKENNHLSTKNNQVKLEAEKEYKFRLEYFNKSGWPQLFVQWKAIDVDTYKKAAELAKNSDLVIFIGGLTGQLEGEEMEVSYPGFKGGDRTTLDLPAVQLELLKVLHATGKPVVLVLSGGSALSVNWENENLPAIVYIWYPGEEGGTAVADMLFGDYNPAGRLPVTFYKSTDQLPPFEDYNMKGRTYRYFNDEPLFPFGYGLSYSSYSYTNMALTDKTETGKEVKVSVEITNTGELSGDEVVQLYIKDLEASVPVPIHSLQSFRRIHLNPGEKKLVEFNLIPKQFSVIGENNKRIVEPGLFEITIGGCQPGTKAATTSYITKQVKLTGEKFLIED